LSRQGHSQSAQQPTAEQGNHRCQDKNDPKSAHAPMHVLNRTFRRGTANRIERAGMDTVVHSQAPEDAGRRAESGKAGACAALQAVVRGGLPALASSPAMDKGDHLLLFPDFKPHDLRYLVGHLLAARRTRRRFDHALRYGFGEPLAARVAAGAAIDIRKSLQYLPDVRIRLNN